MNIDDAEAIAASAYATMNYIKKLDKATKATPEQIQGMVVQFKDRIPSFKEAAKHFYNGNHFLEECTTFINDYKS